MNHDISSRVEFVDVHRLSVGQVKHSPEVFYAGSLWKVILFTWHYVDCNPKFLPDTLLC